MVSYKIGVCKVSPKGKDCSTTFQKLKFNGQTSVVLCKPHTGRMHQIRVHLQYLGKSLKGSFFIKSEVVKHIKSVGFLNHKLCIYKFSMNIFFKRKKMFFLLFDGMFFVKYISFVKI